MTLAFGRYAWTLAGGALLAACVACSCARWAPLGPVTYPFPPDTAQCPPEGMSVLGLPDISEAGGGRQPGLGCDFAARFASVMQKDWVARGLTRPVGVGCGVRCECGLPFRAFAAVVDCPGGYWMGGNLRDAFWFGTHFNPPTGRRLSVLRPLWPGLLLDALIFGAMLYGLWYGPGIGRRAIRRRRGLCPACAYPVGVSERCTECGVTLRPAVTLGNRGRMSGMDECGEAAPDDDVRYGGE
jgi:hypothetical protein